jgi:hypothetical protein
MAAREDKQRLTCCTGKENLGPLTFNDFLQNYDITNLIRKKSKSSKQDNQNRLGSPMSEGGEC